MTAISKPLLRTLFTIIFAIINISFAMNCDSGDAYVNFTFILVFFSIFFIGLYNLIIERIFSPYLVSFLIFNYLFFFLAPIFQINFLPTETVHLGGVNGSFPNTFPYTPAMVVNLNLFITTWNIIFFSAYIFFKQKYLAHIDTSSKWSPSMKMKPNHKLYVYFLLALSVIAVIIEADLIITLIKREPIQLSLSKKLIIIKTVFSIPIAAFVMTLPYIKSEKKYTQEKIIALILALISIILVIVVKNPLIEKRQAMGPIFISIAIFSAHRFFNSNKKFASFMLISMLVVFPALSLITHNPENIKSIIAQQDDKVKEQLKYMSSFNSLNYDAYANTLATIEYVENNGTSKGWGLFGAIMFFIPREKWDSKPMSTGKLIGKHLMSEYYMWFDNLSNPFISEGIINFKWFSIFIFPIILAYLIVFLTKWQYTDDILKQLTAIYFSIHLMFFLRGDLFSGWSYFIGHAIGFYIIPKTLFFTVDKISNYLTDYNKTQ